MKNVRDNDDTATAERSAKRQRVVTESSKLGLTLLEMPMEVINKCVSYVATNADRFSLQVSCKALRQATNEPDVLKPLKLVGDAKTGKGSLLQQYRHDGTVDNAITKLEELARIGNVDAIYLLGMMSTYCSDDNTSCHSGAIIFSAGVKLNDPRCMYELSMIGEKTKLIEGALFNRQREAMSLLEKATALGYLPAAVDKGPWTDVCVQNLGFKKANELGEYLKEHHEFPKILRRGPWGKMLHEVSKDPNKRRCHSSTCRRWAYRNTHLKRIKEMEKDNKEWDQTLYSDAAESIAKHYDIPIDAFPKGVKMFPLATCGGCAKADYCGHSCMVVHWLIHKHECRRAP